MRVGGGKNKGTSFERSLCVRFSLWVSGGRRRDLFWRSAMSGGRATVAKRKGIDLGSQCGDMCSVAPEGHDLTDRFYFEFKHYRDIKLASFILLGTGPIANWWKKTRTEAKQHLREPVLIVKGNHMPILVITPPRSGLNPAPVALTWSTSHNCAIGLLDRTLNTKFDAEEWK